MLQGTLSNDGQHLYMCNTGTPGGISAFAVDRKTGALRLLNYKESKGRGPSYVSVDASGKYVLDANYGGGFVEVYSLAKDGSLDQQTAFVQHIGSSVNVRQSKPYAHWFRTDPSNKFGLVADDALGAYVGRGINLSGRRDDGGGVDSGREFRLGKKEGQYARISDARIGDARKSDNWGFRVMTRGRLARRSYRGAA